MKRKYIKYKEKNGGYYFSRDGWSPLEKQRLYITDKDRFNDYRKYLSKFKNGRLNGIEIVIDFAK